jgi:hypothetical protein
MMMHSNDFVVAILHNGNFVEESKGGVVALPFGAEYAIRLRNKKHCRAVAQVFIDEENVSKGGIVVPAQGFVDLECDVATLRKFKFVSANSDEAIDAGKNNKTDDSNGVIRVEWRTEKEFQQPIYVAPPPVWPRPRPFDNRRYYQNTKDFGTMHSLAHEPEEYTNGSALDFVECDTPKALPTSKLAEGCTVQGSESNQRFNEIWFQLDDAVTTIRLTLRGYDAPVAVQGQHCENCGVKRKSNKAKFCWSCGNSLTKLRSGV